MSVKGLLNKSVIAVVLIMILLIPGSKVFGRYYTENKNEISFTVQTNNTISIYNEQKLEVPDKQIQWDTSNRDSTFYLATYDSENNITLENNIEVMIEIFIPDDIVSTQSLSQSFGNLTIKMVLPDESTQTYTARAEYISSKTKLYKEKGAGWIYRFYDSQGKNVKIQIPGKQLYDSKIEITLLNQDIDIVGTIGVKCKWA